MYKHTNAYLISEHLTEFYAKQVGRNFDYAAEALLLSNWHDAIEDGLIEAKKARLRWMIRDMLNFKQECDILMSISANS